MTEWVDLKAVVDHLASDALLEPASAGLRLQGALFAGEIRTRSPGITIRSEDGDPDRYEDEFEIPSKLWAAVAIDWSDKYPFYRFIEQIEPENLQSIDRGKQTVELHYLTSNVEANETSRSNSLGASMK